MHIKKVTKDVIHKPLESLEKQEDSAERAELLGQTTSVSESTDQEAVDGK